MSYVFLSCKIIEDDCRRPPTTPGQVSRVTIFIQRSFWDVEEEFVGFLTLRNVNRSIPSTPGDELGPLIIPRSCLNKVTVGPITHCIQLSVWCDLSREDAAKEKLSDAFLGLVTDSRAGIMLSLIRSYQWLQGHPAVAQSW